jgi:PAS domain S-box-containing protein
MRQMTEALRASEERFQLAVRGSSAGIWDWNILTDEVFYAPRFREMIGQEIEAGFPSRISSFWEVLHPEDRSAVQAALAASLSPQNTPYDVEYRMRTRTGGDRWFHARGEVLRDNQGQPYRMAGSITDITWRKEVENELRHLNAELEKRVHERTTELAKRIVEVEQLNGELESFSYSVSHDLRSPLRNITGFIELLEGRLAGRLELDEKRYFATVTREAGRLSVLIDDLLAFSRMGRAQMKLGPVPLVDLVQEVRAELVSNAAARPIEWKIADLPVVEGDRALLRLALVNLLGNAFKFTKQRPLAVIEIGIHGSGVEDSGRITFFVRDNGAGFNPKYQDKLFGVFQRLHNAREFEGTGIGLANVKRIIERHGGRVWAEGTVKPRINTPKHGLTRDNTG